VNNAGILAVPKRQLTADGFELQSGTNTEHLREKMARAMSYGGMWDRLVLLVRQFRRDNWMHQIIRVGGP